MKIIYSLLLTTCSSIGWCQEQLKDQLIESIDRLAPELISISNQIWDFAEPAYNEFQSSALLKEQLRREGFLILDSAGGISTQFVASYGIKGPVIGLFAEYDADEGASNEVVPMRHHRPGQDYGHGGHHNLLGVGSLGTALALKEVIDKGQLQCRIRFYGTTDEGGIGGKVALAHQGLFDELDFSIYWHPSPVTMPASNIWDSMFEFRIIMISQQKSGIVKPRELNDPLYAFEKFYDKIDSMRVALNPEIRMNYTFEESNPNLQTYPNSLPIRTLIQHYDQQENTIYYQAIKRLIEEFESEEVTFELVRAKHKFIPNQPGLELVHRNMLQLGSIKYSKDELDFIDTFNSSTNSSSILNGSPLNLREVDMNKLYGYSSDIGEASWFAPEIYFVVSSLPRGAHMHDWQGTIFSGHSIGHKGMIYAAKIMAMTIADFVKQPDLQKHIREDWVRKKAGRVYGIFR